MLVRMYFISCESRFHSVASSCVCAAVSKSMSAIRVVARSACLTCRVLQLCLSLLVSAVYHVLLLLLSLLVASVCHVLVLLLSLLVSAACHALLLLLFLLVASARHVLHFASPSVFGTCTSIPQMFHILCCRWLA